MPAAEADEEKEKEEPAATEEAKEENGDEAKNGDDSTGNWFFHLRLTTSFSPVLICSIWLLLHLNHGLHILPLPRSFLPRACFLTPRSISLFCVVSSDVV